MPQALAQNASALRSRQISLAGQLEHNQFQRPIAFESTQVGDTLRGDIYAVIAQPYRVIKPALQELNNWCDLLILHLNVKQCRSNGSGLAGTIQMVLGQKFEQSPSKSYPVDFSFRVTSNDPDYLAIELNADSGPLGTKDYKVIFEVTPLDQGRSFLHMSYSYSFGAAAQIAMQFYLSTIGRNKVGFSIIDHQTDGTSVFVGGMRGVIERNTMRYYLAIEVYLSSLLTPVADQTEKRLRDWFDASERYQRQLHELTWEDYLAMKRKEMSR
jgi:hypothetical protein